ncbi:MAG: lipid export ATP-binding/permease protein MsbA [Ferruginibacter sp.]|nr:lipid export ATP-binding/permease protein MsbA [Ferruginibacter sp.]
MRNFFRIFKYIHIPKDKLALYTLYTLLATFFSLLSIGMLSPFMNLIFNAGNATGTIQSNSIGQLKNYLQPIVDRDKLAGLAIICVIIVLATLLKNLFLYLSYYISTPVRNEIVSSFRLRLYDKILKLPVSFFTTQKKGDVMSRMTSDIGEIQSSIVQTLEGFIKDPVTIIGFLAYMVYLSPKLSLFLLILLPLTALIIGRISKKLKKQSTQFSVISGENLSHVEETLGGIKVIKAFTAENRMMNKFKQTNDQLFVILNKMTKRRDLASPLTEVLGVFVLCIILYVGGTLVFSPGRDLASGDLMPFIISFAMMINPAKNFSTTMSNIQRGLGAIERLEEVLNAPVLVEEKPDAVVFNGFHKNVEFRNVCFRYHDKEILKNINLTIQKGKMVALVGSSGAGKSTLADLIPRFHDVSSGGIFIDGVNIKDYTIESLRKQMSIVTQEPILFNESIANNIALGNIKASIEEVTSAAKIANAHNFIVNKDEGYNTNIGDRGMKLSGGERQRVTIARAVLQNPPILILDEATSSLDTESERLVQDAIVNLMLDRTSLVIAHRLSTIRNADEIIVLQKGEIIERGTHEALIEQNGFYRKLVEMQEIK